MTDNAPLRVLQFGVTGQVGLELIAAAAKSGIEIRALSSSEIDFTRPLDIAKAIRDADPFDVVVNAVAYTAAEKAETDVVRANLVNGHAVGVMAEACAARAKPLIHISTDYVFDGQNLELTRRTTRRIR